MLTTNGEKTHFRMQRANLKQPDSVHIPDINHEQNTMVLHVMMSIPLIYACTFLGSIPSSLPINGYSKGNINTSKQSNSK